MIKFLLVYLCLFLTCLPGFCFASGKVLINEFSQGSSGSKEYIEFVVQGQRTCNDSIADIRGWIFDDNNGWYGTGASSPGFYRFKPDVNWSGVPYGSLIVIYNPSDINPAVPADDPYDVNGDHVYILPVNSSLIEFNGSNSYTNTGFGPSLNWDGIVLNNTNDAVQTLDPNDLSVAAHAVSYGANYYAPVNISPSGAGQTVYYLTSGLYNSTAAWTKGNVSLYQTPGTANTPANATWINGMNINQGAAATVSGITKTICANQLPYLWNGFSITSGGNSVAQFITSSIQSGCDSTTVLNLVVMPPAVPFTIDTSGCGVVLFEGQAYHNNKIIIDTLWNQNGCDSIYRAVNIIIHNENPVHKNIDTFGCGQLVFEGNTYSESTTLNDHYTSVLGCDSLYRTVNIIIEEFKMKLSISQEESYEGELIHLETDANMEYSIVTWLPQVLFKEQHYKEQSIVAQQPETIIAIGKSDRGCIDSVIVTNKVLPLQYGVFIPNAFTPNGDGLNDEFAPRFYMARAYYINKLQIFDRWGTSIYNSTGNNARWNGLYLNGLPADDGTYHYVISVKFIDGKEQYFKGDISLLR